MVHTHTMHYYSVIKKWNIVICNKMAGSKEYNVKWNKLDRKGQTLYDLAYMWNLKQNKQNKMKTDSQIQITN